MMKKIYVLASICFLVIISTVFASGEMKFVDIKVFFDGEKAILKDSNNCDTSPIVYNNTVYVPIRNIVEKFDAHIIWNDENKEIKIYKDYFKKIGFQLGGYSVSVDYIDEDGEVINDTLQVEQGFEYFTEFSYDIYEYTHIIDGSQPVPDIFVEALDDLKITIKQATEKEPYAIINVYYGGDNSEQSEYKINFVRDNNSFLKELFEKDGCILLNYQTNFANY